MDKYLENCLVMGDKAYTEGYCANVKDFHFYHERRLFNAARQLVECVVGWFSKFRIVSSSYRSDLDFHGSIMFVIANIINRQLTKKQIYKNKFIFFSKKQILEWDEKKRKEKKKMNLESWVKEFIVDNGVPITIMNKKVTVHSM